MSNIFDGLSKLDDNTIRENIAMLEAITMGSVIKGYGTTIANKSAKLANGIGALFGKKTGVREVKEKRIEDYIREKKRETLILNREELDDRLISVFKEKVGIYNLESKDSISANVINYVGENMNLGANMTVAQKADSIHRRYYERMLESIQKNLKNQNSKEAEKTIKEIEKNINNLSEEDKKELKKVLNIDNLTGKEIRNVLMKAGTPALIIGTLSASGFSAFIALTTIIHAIFTTVLGVTLPFAVYTGATSALSLVLGPIGIAFIAGTTIWQFTKGNKKLKTEILGQIIFSSVSACGGSFVAKNEDLPSHEGNKKALEKIIKRDQEYNNLVKENNNLKGKVRNLEIKYYSSKSDIESLKNEINKEKDKRKNSENEIKKLKLERIDVNNNLVQSSKKIAILEKEIFLKDDEKLKEELENSKNLNRYYEIELKNLSNNIVYQEELIKEASNEIESKVNIIEEKEKKNIILEKENELYKSEIKNKDEKIQITEKIRKKEILEKWNIYYPNFEMKTSAIRDASKFSKKELWEIERVLMELYSLNDYKSVSRGKIKDNGTEYEHLGFSLPCGFPTRILYKINNNSIRKVTIEKIYKHNKKIYQ